MSTAVILQARTGSTRLPNKMLMPFYEDKCILEILLERIKHEAPLIADKLIVATSSNKGDDRIEELCNKIGVKCFRGSEDDVLTRFIDAAKSYNVSKIIRVCADNVFLDINLLEKLYEKLDKSTYDYASYCTSDGTPSIRTHFGFWTEGVSLSALEKIREMTNEKLFHEHVTNYIYSNPEQFTIDLQNINETIKDIESHSNLRLTIDTIEDFNISKDIYSYLIARDIPVSSENIIRYLDEHVELYSKMGEIIKRNSK